jgi:hypothetical protein
MPEAPERLVVGGTIAALCLADALAGAGRPVRLLVPRKGVGGGFLPVQRGEVPLELGMRVLELRYEGVDEPPPLAAYRPDEDGHRPHVARVDAWVRELVGDAAVVPVDAPASYLSGRLGPELLLSSDLRGAATFVDAGDAGRIAAEAERAEAAGGPAGWLAPENRPGLWARSFTEASLHQHGPALHERLLAPFTAKIRQGGGDDVVAALRRKLWVPLFWPRTVAEAFGGRPVGFVPERPLSIVHPGGGIGPVVRALLDRVAARVPTEQYDGVRGVRRDGRAVRLTFADGREEVAEQPVLAMAAGELFAAAGIDYAPAKVRSVLAWLRVAAADLRALPGFVHVHDADVPAYRVTPGHEDPATGDRVLCVELAHDVPAEDAPARARAVLERLGILAEGAPAADLGTFAGPTFTDPTAETVQRHAAAVARWHELALPGLVVGGALTMGADSFNDQVVQGLHAAQALA